VLDVDVLVVVDEEVLVLLEVVELLDDCVDVDEEVLV
jgi:hypothetical protein